MSAGIYFIGAAGAAVVSLFWWRSRLRVREVRSLAESGGFQYLGETLPPSLPLTSMPFASITAVWNAIDGAPRGKRIVAFDCRFGEGKGSWRRTVIAVRTDASNVTASAFDTSLRIEQTDDWVFIYRPKELALIPLQLTPIPELRGYLDNI